MYDLNLVPDILTETLTASPPPRPNNWANITYEKKVSGQQIPVIEQIARSSDTSRKSALATTTPAMTTFGTGLMGT